jgi:hypothetical protein
VRTEQQKEGGREGNQTDEDGTVEGGGSGKGKRRYRKGIPFRNYPGQSSGKGRYFKGN